MKRAEFISLIFGVVLGLSAGLLYSWGVNPVQVVDTDPSALRSDYMDDYLIMIAASYQSTNNLDRARARLAEVGFEEPAAELNQVSQALLDQGENPSQAEALADLALALENGQPLPSGSATPTRATTPQATHTPSSTPTATRTATIMPTPGQPFQLISQEQVCDTDLIEPLIQIVVLDASESPIPGVEIQVVWDTGQSQFFTGLKPELGLGYADFTMTPDTLYTLQVSDSEVPVTDILAEECTSSSGIPFLGSWLFVFQQPELE
jgi:hypothetical protein